MLDFVVAFVFWDIAIAVKADTELFSTIFILCIMGLEIVFNSDQEMLCILTTFWVPLHQKAGLNLFSIFLILCIFKVKSDRNKAKKHSF